MREERKREIEGGVVPGRETVQYWLHESSWKYSIMIISVMVDQNRTDDGVRLDI